MRKITGIILLFATSLMSGCASHGPTPEQISERTKQTEALRLASEMKQAHENRYMQCLKSSYDDQFGALVMAGYNILHRRNGTDAEWTLGSPPNMPDKALHFLRKVENGRPPGWFTAQLYINPTGYLLAADATHKQSETSDKGRVMFQIYAFTPEGYTGIWGDLTKYQKKPFDISFQDIFNQPGDGDYLVAVMPTRAKLPARILEILAHCDTPIEPPSNEP